MRRHALITLLLGAITCSTTAEQNIHSEIEKINAKLQVINNLGIECETELQMHGIQGGDSNACKKYLTNTQGKFFASIDEHCKTLTTWYDNKRDFIRENPDYAETNITAAQTLIADMRAVLAACNSDTWQRNYPHLTRPLSTIEALSQLE